MSIAHQKYLSAIKTKLEQQPQGTEAYKSELSQGSRLSLVPSTTIPRSLQ